MMSHAQAGATTKAIVQNRYGSPAVLAYEEIPMPTVHDREVLVRVRAAGVDPGVAVSMTGRPLAARLAVGLFKPKRRVPGRALAGRVEVVGRDVTVFAPGDEVYGEAVAGAYAQHAAVRADWLARKPPSLTFEQAAAIPLSGVTALQGLRDKGRIQAGQRVLVNGASGGVGTLAVQIAKAFGAHVTAVCSTRNIDLVRSIGADDVIDYAREDFTGGERTWDLIFDLVASHTLRECRRALTPTGTLVLAGGPPESVLRRLVGAMVLSTIVRQRLVPLLQRLDAHDLDTLTELVECGSVRPVIDRTFALADVPDALRRQAEGHARGKTVIVVE